MTPRIRLALALASILSPISALANAPRVLASTLIVSPGSSTIHAALASASSGDTLLLQPGTYATTDPVDIHKSVTIISDQGPANTIVDLQYNFGSVFYIYPMSGGPTIQGLTIKRGAQIFTGAGAGVYAAGASPTIVNNLFVANGASNIDGYGGAGAAIAILDGNPVIRQNTIVNNFASYGAVYLYQCGGELEGNIIAYNYDTHEGEDTGYGLVCDNATTLIRDNLFWANTPAQVHPACGLEVPGSANNNVIDPKFCNPVIGPKAMNGDWGVRSDGPTGPGHPYYGWGASIPGCVATSAVRRSWGSIKNQYR
jgi:hypothetical protein